MARMPLLCICAISGSVQGQDYSHTYGHGTGHGYSHIAMIARIRLIDDNSTITTKTGAIGRPLTLA